MNLRIPMPNQDFWLGLHNPDYSDAMSRDLKAFLARQERQEQLEPQQNANVFGEVDPRRAAAAAALMELGQTNHMDPPGPSTSSVSSMAKVSVAKRERVNISPRNHFHFLPADRASTLPVLFEHRIDSMVPFGWTEPGPVLSSLRGQQHVKTEPFEHRLDGG